MISRITIVLLFFALSSLNAKLIASAIEDYKDAIHCIKTKNTRKKKKCTEKLKHALDELLLKNNTRISKFRPDTPVPKVQKRLKAIQKLVDKINITKPYLGDTFVAEEDQLKANQAMLKKRLCEHYKNMGLQEWEGYLVEKNKCYAQKAYRYFEQAKELGNDPDLDSLKQISRKRGTYNLYIEATPARNSNLSDVEINDFFENIENKGDTFHQFLFEKNKHLADCEIYFEIQKLGLTTSENKKTRSYNKKIEEDILPY